MKKFIVASALALSLLVPGVAFAALSETQIAAVLGLLRAFNADESALYDVEASLRGEVLGAAVACPALTMTLQRGMSDATTKGQVTELQKFLAGYYALQQSDAVTGYFGALTLKNILRFQVEQGISALGIVGPQTRARIAALCAGSSVSTTPILKPGPICPAIAFMPIECATGAPTPRYDANGCQTGWQCTATSTAAVLNVTLDASSPAYKLVAAGTNDVVIGAFKLRAGGESVMVQRMAVKLTSGVASDLVKVAVYDGVTKVGDGFILGGATTASITFLSNVLVPKDTDKVLTIKGDFSLIGTGEPVGVSGHLVQVDFLSGQGVGKTSGTVVNATGSTAVAGVRVAKSFLTVTDISSTLTPGGLADGRLMRFKVTADSHGAIGLGRFALAVFPNSASLGVTNITLYAFEDSNYSIPASGTGSSDGMIPATDAGSWWPSPTSPIQVPAGASRYFEVRGAVSGSTSGSAVTTTLLGDSAYSGIGIYSIQKEKGYFIWSPNSISQSVKSDNDWTNGYGVSGLPATGLSHTRTSGTAPSTGCKLEITKTVDREDYKSFGAATVTPNENLSYTIQFKNSGTARCSASVKVQDILDPNLTYVSETHSANVTAGYYSLPAYQSTTRTVSFNAWDLDPSETGWVKIQTKVGTPSSCSVIVPNSAMITAYEYNNFSTWVYSNTASVTLKKDCPIPTTSISVTAPNGGERWEQATMNTITWTPYAYTPTEVNPARDVKAYLEQKVGTSYVVVGTVLPSGKASIHWEGDIDTFGKYPAPGSYYVRVVNTVTGQSDRSDAPFTILPRSVDLKLNGFDGPISASLNTPVTASWTSTGATSCQLYNAYDVSSAQATTSIIPVATSGQRQIYVGNLPSWSVTLVCTRTSDGRSVYDSVTVNVTNTESRVKVVSPNGGETLPLNQTFNILWERAGIKSASIALYRNDQWVKWLSQEVVSDNEPRMFAWTPSLDEAETMAPWRGSVYKIYITGQKSDGTGYVDDKSDAPFGFSGATQPPVPATLSLTSPLSGSTVTVGNPIPISWSFTNAPKNSQILLTVKNVQPSNPASGTSSGGSWQSTLIPTTNGTGSYSWTTGLGYLDFTGTYQVTAQLKQCDPNGCNYNYNLPLPVFATSNTVQFTVAPRPAGSVILNPTSSGPGSGVQDF